MSERARVWALERGGLLAIVTLLVYAWLAPHHVVDGDNSEFSTLSATGGIAHPSGYPLYVLWLRAMSWLPGASPAHTAALATAIVGAASVLVLHAACRAWGARAFAATIACLVFATGPVVLRVVTEAEVFALNNLAVATVLWLAALHGPARGITRALLLGLVAGLGLANHLTCSLVAPIGLLGAWRGVQEAGSRKVVAGAAAVGGLVLGLVPYAYLLVAPETPMSWGVERNLDGVIATVLREDYGGPTAFRVAAIDVSPWTNIVALARTIGRSWLWLPAIAAIVMLVVRCVRSVENGEPRAGWWMLACAWLVAGPLLVTRFNVPPEGLGLYVNQRFHLLPTLLLALPVALAVDRITVPRIALATLLASTVGVPLSAAPSLGYVGRVHSPAVEASARNMLHSLPPGAVVIHGQDELHAVPGYVQWALGQRQDVVIVTWPLMGLTWYRERVAKRGIVWGPGAGAPQVRLVGHLLARGRPVFVDRLQHDVIGAFATHPYGILVRVLPPGAAMPSVREVFDLNEQLYSKFALDYPVPGPDDEFATEVHARYRDIWQMIAIMAERHGLAAEAAQAREHARRLAPR